MTDNYRRIMQENLERLFQDDDSGLGSRLGAERGADGNWRFSAFGRDCRLGPQGIWLDDVPADGVRGVLLSLYGLHARPVPLQREPFRAYREFPNATPYQGAFATHTEGILVPHVHRILTEAKQVRERLQGMRAPDDLGGDAAFVVHPVPKIALCYIFYEADDEFPAGVTCLYSANADRFMPVDGLADLGEYTSKEMIRIVGQGQE